MRGEIMKMSHNSTTRQSRFVNGTALYTAIFAASALQAQSTGPSAAPPRYSAPISHAAKEFLQFAVQANQTEIVMANAAEVTSQNDAVRDLARMLLIDHHQNYSLLQSIAQNHGVALDPSLDRLNRQAVNRLEKVSDAAFDRDYTSVVLKDHVKSITRFDRALSDIQEPSIREYAQNTLATLRQHLRHSEDAARAAGVDEVTISSILRGLPNDEALRAVAVSRP
jgi:putative membrane protein